MKKYVGINDLKDLYAEKEGITKVEAKRILNSVFELEQEVLLDPETQGIQIIGFMTLEKVERKGRIGRNPRKPHESMEIPPYTTLRVKIGKPLKDSLNNK